MPGTRGLGVQAMALRLSLPAPSVITVIILPFGQAKGAGRAFRSEVEVFGGADGGVRGRQQEDTDDLGDQAEILSTLSGLRAWIVPAPAAWLAKI